MRYYLTPVRMAVTKKTRDNKCRWRFGKREPLGTVGGNVNYCSHYGKHYGSSSPFNMMLTMSLLHIAFIILTYDPPIKFVEIFYPKWMLNSIKWFSYFYWDQQMIFILHFVYVAHNMICLPHKHIVTDWQMLNHLCVPGINPT